MSSKKASISEFSIIEKYFSNIGQSKGVSLGVGDDCAILEIPSDKQLVTSVDTLVEAIHFPSNSSPSDIAQRALRVNLSDIAAMGAEPHWFTLALTHQTGNEEWIYRFSKALERDAKKFGCTLVGGDLTAGPLSITIQVLGTVDRGKAIKRSGVKEGDYIYVTGSLGELPRLPLFLKNHLIYRTLYLRARSIVFIINFTDQNQEYKRVSFCKILHLQQ